MTIMKNAKTKGDECFWYISLSPHRNNTYF